MKAKPYTPVVTADNIKEGREMSISRGIMSDEDIRKSERIEQLLRDEERKHLTNPDSCGKIELPQPNHRS